MEHRHTHRGGLALEKERSSSRARERTGRGILKQVEGRQLVLMAWVFLEEQIHVHGVKNIPAAVTS